MYVGVSLSIGSGFRVGLGSDLWLRSVSVGRLR